VQVEEHLALSLLYGLGVFLLQDFIHYWAHRAYHSRYLWAFHKVHHSAPVLVPVTASRDALRREMVERLIDIVFLSAFAGVFWYACGGEISRYTLFGVTYMVFILNTLAANLRHSHVWLSFGPVVEHVLNSPAQHQIHHSDAPRHFTTKTTASTCRSGTGCSARSTSRRRNPSPFSFGTGEADHERYLTLYSLIVTPFVENAGQASPGETAGPDSQRLRKLPAFSQLLVLRLGQLHQQRGLARVEPVEQSRDIFRVHGGAAPRRSSDRARCGRKCTNLRGDAGVLCSMKMPWRYKSSLRRMRSALFQSFATVESSTSSL
jgi:hypothetical protein